MYRHALMQYRVHEYIMDTYVCEKFEFTLVIDSHSYNHIERDFISFAGTKIISSKSCRDT
jgi:hypothetical protein